MERVQPPDTIELYLDLLKRTLTNFIYQDPNVSPWLPKEFIAEKREEGADWPRDAHTMVGLKRLDNLQFCIEQVLKQSVLGDFVETGVWRGGASIFMRAMLKAYNVLDRQVWVVDSFAGLPAPDPDTYPEDKDDQHHTFEYLAVPLEIVQDNFRRYDLLDKQVQFLKGWFKDTLPTAPFSMIAVLRLDGDMYESTMDVLKNTYHKLSPGGFIIIDDYKVVPGCRKAVDQFRKEQNISAELWEIDWAGVFWKK